MTNDISYKSTFVNELSDVLLEMMPALTGNAGGGGMMGMLVNAIAPEIPVFLQALDDNADMQIMFGAIIKKLHIASDIDAKARQAYLDQFSVVSNEVEQANEEAKIEIQEERDEEDVE